MSHSWLILLLLSSLAFGQAQPPAKPKTEPAQPPVTAAPKPQPASPESVAPTGAVITLVGMCDAKAGAVPPADCKTVVTRAEFEKLMKALNPQMPTGVRQQLALTLARIMVAAHEAEKMGLQNRPETQELVRYARTQALAQALLLALQDKFAHSSPAEIQKYYDENKPQFEEATLKRVYVPKPRGANGKAETGKDAGDDVAKAAAEKIHQEAVAGTDFDKLQKEAFQAASIDATPPPTSIGTVKLINMPEKHKPVFDLKPGEVSQPIPDASGFYIYKLESKQMIPVAQAKESIEKTLQGEKLEKALQQMSDSVKPQLNPVYFGTTGEAPAGETGAAHAPVPKPRAPVKAAPPSKPPASAGPGKQ